MHKHIAKHKYRLKLYFFLIIGVVCFSYIFAKTVYFAGADNNVYTIRSGSIDPSSIDKSVHKNLQLKTFKLQAKCIPDTKTVSSEPAILWAVSPGPGGSVGKGGSIKVWYNDEWPITLGQGSSITTNYNGHLTNPDVGDITARDHMGLPFFPAIFISDITYDANNTSGDAENGGTAYKPDEVWGAWKPSGAATVANYNQGSPNFLNLPQGADPFPSKSNATTDDTKLLRRPREAQNGTELIWNVNNLPLTEGHAYRVQIILHDGDQFFGGDLGIGCSTIQV